MGLEKLFSGQRYILLLQYYVPSTQVRWLKAACNPSSTVPEALPWTLRDTLTHMYTNPHPYPTHNYKLNKP